MISFLLLLSACSKKSHVIDCYPTQVGNSWEYSRTFYTVVYDTVNNDTTEFLITDSLHEEFENIDTVAGWECYRLNRTLYEQSSTFSQIQWYAQPDTALLYIAYLFGATLISPVESRANTGFQLDGIIFETPNALAQYLFYRRNTGFQTISVDSLLSDTMYWSPPKKLFVFPLRVGSSWIATMEDPWLEEREVVSAESVTVLAGNFLTLKIDITFDIMTENDLWNR